MNLGTQIPVMPTSSAAAVSWNSTGAGNGNTSDRFPAGLRVLVVDDDPTCLMILEKMLRNCKYEVTKCNRAEVALSLLRENKNGFDVVISDVHMPDMDGFKLLVHIGLEMDLPVIMMSADDSKSVVMKGVTHGACDYLIKPVRIEALRNIWQHVVRKKKHEWKDKDNNDPSTSLDDGEQRQQKKRREEEEEDPEYSSSANEGYNWKNAKRKKDDEDEIEERDDSSSLKKPRVVWTQELHQQFVAAVNQLGIDKAVPKKILDLMNVPGLTRENVASHLQKYRLYLRRLSGSHQSGGINPSFMGNSDAGYSQLSEFDLQALAASGQLGQLPAQSLATLQAALGRSSNSKSIVDQRNFFSFENPMRYTHTQVQNRQGHNGNINNNNNNNINKMNLLHGIPTTMEPKQLVGLQRSFVGMNSQTLIPMTGQSQSQTHVSRQPVLPSFPTNNRTENTFSLRGSLGISSIMPTSTLQNKSNNWSSSSQGNDLTFAASPQLTNNNNNTQGGLNALQHNYTSGNRTEGGNVTLPTGEGSGTHILQNPSRQPFFPDEYSQDDLLSTILPQQQHQEEIVQAENEFGFDWYSLDNLPV